MMILLIILIVITAIALVCVLRIIYELHTLRLVNYVVYSEKIAETVRVLCLSDLHGRKYGPHNRDLIRMAVDSKPNLILIAGDLITFGDYNSIKVADMLLHTLTDIAPVFYIPGNHEQQTAQSELPNDKKAYERLMDAVSLAKVNFLENETVHLPNNISIIGFAPEEKYYPKFKKMPEMPVEYMDETLGEIDIKRFNIMLAHHPGYFKTYAEFEPDLIISGHYHGGAIRFPHLGGFISPQFKIFPPFFYGRFEKWGSIMIVSAGCGSHKVNLRLNNMPELVVIDIKPPK